MSISKKLTAAGLAAALVFSASACSLIQKTDEPIIPPSPDTTVQTKDTAESDKDGVSSEPVKAKAIKVKSGGEDITEKDIELTLEVGGEKSYALTSDTNESPVWSSSDESVATVDGSGNIKALSEGTCKITGTVASNSDIAFTIDLTVKAKREEVSSSESSSKPIASSAPQSSAESSKPEQPAPTQQTAASEMPQEIVEMPAPISHEPEKVSGIDITFSTTVMTVGQTLNPIITLTPDYVDSTAVTLTSSDLGILTINGDGTVTAQSQGACTITAVPESNKELSASVIVTVTEPVIDSEDEEYDDEDDRPIVDNSDLPRSECYVDGILIVNKTYSIPASYNPGGLTAETQAAFSELVAGAAADGISIWNASGFRSYEYQSSLYWSYVSWYGQATADTFSARPGHSEHQTGMAIDCNIINDSFTGTPAAIWLENHCHEYGFIIRYPYGKQAVTGYKYEPWHIRYIGDKATDIYESGLTLEEYYGLTSVYGG